jgi:mannose-6-phosphate isomerase-like protein (cupin superfamily)
MRSVAGCEENIVNGGATVQRPRGRIGCGRLAPSATWNAKPRDAPAAISSRRGKMKKGPFISNAAESLWESPAAGHFDGAYSKMLVNASAGGARHVDYRISSYQPKGHVAAHSHKVQEQIYHILEGEGLMQLDGTTRVVRRHDIIFIPPGTVHALHNTGFQDLIFIVVTTPASDEAA